MAIFLTLSVLAVTLVCCVGEWLPLDIVAITVAVVLILLGLVTPEEGISGFSNAATITVMAMFILSAGVARTGAIQEVKKLLLRWGGKHPTQQILTLGVLAGPVTAFINNTAVVAVFLPIVEEWCKKQGISVSKVLIPLSYATILGGMITVIGTSTNVLASGLSEQLGYGSFQLFQFTRLGLVTFVVGLGYLAFIAPALLPNRKTPSDDIIDQNYGLEDYVSEVVIKPRSSLIGRTLATSCIQRSSNCPGQMFDVDVLEIIRQGKHFSHPLDHRVLSAGDVLLVRSTREDLLQIKEEKGIDILPEVKFNDQPSPAELEARADCIAEALITSNSDLVGSNLRELRFRQRYNVTVLAIRRDGASTRTRLDKISLRFGDVLLLQGPKPNLLGLQTSRNLLVVGQQDLETLRRDKAGIALVIGLGVLLLAALNWLSILVSSLVGAVLMVLTGCLKPGELYGAVRWNIIFLLAGLIPLGIAMENSGATHWLATHLIAVGSTFSGYGLLTFFFIITALLTELLSNNASVVLLLPIAAEVAQDLNFNPFAFMFAVTFAASSSFMTPIGYQTNTMVYGPGGYKFLDFFRVGLPLSLLMTLIIPPLIILFYGLQP
ncbi:MAG: SLC13 family permease [Cyanothece sp. SIO1E1]|nr:SLC13 family permease [Cyanothece sp. SIO1E1]